MVGQPSFILCLDPIIIMSMNLPKNFIEMVISMFMCRVTWTRYLHLVMSYHMHQPLNYAWADSVSLAAYNSGSTCVKNLKKIMVCLWVKDN